MICNSIKEPDFEKCLSILGKSQFSEIRNDLCNFTVAQIDNLTSKFPNIIFTDRFKQGATEGCMIAAIKNGVKYIDIEFEYPSDIASKLKKAAISSGTKIIISYHNYYSTPSHQELLKIIDKCRNAGADIVKIATTALDISDAVRVMRLYKEQSIPKGTLVAFTMGTIGKFTRTLSLRLGSPFSYSSQSDETITAPGQYTTSEMNKILRKGTLHLDQLKNKPSTPSLIEIPCSKSVAQRAIICAALTNGTSTLSNYSPCNDNEAALKIIDQIGCKNSTAKGDLITIYGKCKEILSHRNDNSICSLNVGESGLLARMIMPICGVISLNNPKIFTISGTGSILCREMSSTFDALEKTGLKVTPTIKRDKKYLPCTISGMIKSPDITIDGYTSSQIVTGLLIALPMLNHNTILKVYHPKSRPYLDLTIDILKKFNICIEQKVKEDSIIYHIKGSQTFKPAKFRMESDWSSASCLIVATAILSSKMQKSEVAFMTFEKMPFHSHQADEQILSIIKQCGCNFMIQENSLKFFGGSKLKSFTFDATESPDLFPALSVLACFCKGKSKIGGISRLLQKESNRAESIFSELTILGADIDIIDDFMYICESELTGGDVKSHNDHRIVMSLAVAALFAPQTVTIDETECVNKSFPAFWKVLTDAFIFD